MPCGGDSGGPLVKTEYVSDDAERNDNEAICLYGVIVMGSNGCDGGVSVSARVSSHEEWIEETMSQNNIFDC